MTTYLTIYKNPVKGGAFARLMRLTEALASAGHQVHYISTDRFPLSHHKQATGHILPFAGGGIFSYVLFFLWLLFYVPYIVLRYRVEVIYSFSPLYSASCLLAKPFVRLVTFVRGDWMEELRVKGRPIPVRLAAHFVQASAFLLSDRVVTVTEDLLRRVKAQVPSADVVLLPNEVPKLKLARHKKKKFTIAYAGPLERIKSVDTLLNAFASAKLKHTDLIIIGSGSDEQRLKLLAKSNASFLGWRTDVPRLLADSDLLVLPSLYEGSPNVILEAFAVGTPVIGRDVGGIRETLEHDNLLFSTQDGLASLLAKIRNNKSFYRQISKECAARKKAFTFDWDAKATAALSFQQSK